MDVLQSPCKSLPAATSAHIPLAKLPTCCHPAGTGKTSTISAVLSGMCGVSRPDTCVVVAAPTNKAVSVVADRCAVPHPAPLSRQVDR